MASLYRCRSRFSARRGLGEHEVDGQRLAGDAARYTSRCRRGNHVVAPAVRQLGRVARLAERVVLLFASSTHVALQILCRHVERQRVQAARVAVRVDLRVIGRGGQARVDRLLGRRARRRGHHRAVGVIEVQIEVSRAIAREPRPRRACPPAARSCTSCRCPLSCSSCSGSSRGRSCRAPSSGCAPPRSACRRLPELSSAHTAVGPRTRRSAECTAVRSRRRSTRSRRPSTSSPRRSRRRTRRGRSSRPRCQSHALLPAPHCVLSEHEPHSAATSLPPAVIVARYTGEVVVCAHVPFAPVSSATNT